MTLTDVLKDFAYLSTLLLIGFELRRRIRIFQKYFIPSALIAGTIGMFLGPSWLGTVSPVYIPFSGGIGQWSGALVIFVCATMFLGLELNKVGRDGMAATFLAGFCHQAQMLLGLAIAAVFGLFIALPYQFGYMGVWGFYAGHGNATTVGNIIQDAGYWDDAVGVGVTFATIGILCGIILG
ncbi:MAG: sodium/glutamate symporter, partial [[Clostridium] symbiosum]